jgi:hypothetical protein
LELTRTLTSSGNITILCITGATSRRGVTSVTPVPQLRAAGHPSSLSHFTSLGLPLEPQKKCISRSPWTTSPNGQKISHPQREASTVADFLKTIFFRFGVLMELHNDQNWNFEPRLMQEVLD